MRDAAEIPMSRLGLALGVSRSLVRQIEEGEVQTPKVDLAEKIADLFGVSLDWLVSGKGEGPGAQELEAARDRVARLTSSKGTGTDG